MSVYSSVSGLYTWRRPRTPCGLNFVPSSHRHLLKNTIDPSTQGLVAEKKDWLWYNGRQ